MTGALVGVLNAVRAREMLMGRLRWFSALAVLGCAFVVAGSAGAEKPPAPPPSPGTPASGSGEQKDSLEAVPVSGDPSSGKAGASSAGTVGPAAPTGYTRVKSPDLSSPAGKQVHGKVVCPAGTVVWGGGVLFGSSDLAASVNSSRPYQTTKGWEAWVNNGSADDTTFAVWAVCAKKPAGYAVVKHAVTNRKGEQTFGSAACAGTKVELGGGVFSSSRNLSVNINSTYPGSAFQGFRGWVAYMNNASAANAKMTVYSICAKPVIPGYEVLLGPATANPDGGQTLASQVCTAGKVPVGGGISSDSASLLVTLNSTAPSSDGWIGFENNASGAGTTMNALVICVS